ncbi:LysR family transcriptional regulator [Jiella pelagia]|uniref:LysR substrate-binding domain-containing protein n=1 Tax=Jiella pelagia TaxID=2986949 RepID=A0ABY7C284_9HYPH|nr:LysR substrate-binding domain-containing protein [Jiella pelagia]WAP69851.1 LysR substrate-binding domain-containing protein [Jiella pelagia]
MDLRLLEAFRAVVSNHSVTRAAKVLGLTQPAVSAQLARLEAAVGFQLFLRSGGRLSLTREGEEFHREMIHALGMYDRLDRVAEAIREGRSGRLVLASHPSASISLLPPLVSRFTLQLPEIHVRMLNRTSEEVRSFFPAASIDIGIAELPVDIVGVKVRRYQIDCVAVLPRGHPAARHPVLTPVELAGVPFFAMPPERVISHRVKTAFAQAGVSLQTIAEVDFFSSICALVANGGGVSVVDIFSARMFEALGLEIRPFQPAIPYEIGVLTSEDRPLSPLAKDFLDLLDTTLRTESAANA